MINLFEENQYIKKSGSINEPIFDVASNETIELLIDWNKCDAKRITINVGGTGLVSLLEIGEAYEAEVLINVLPYARLSHSIAFFGENNKAKYLVNQAESSEYNGALADFTVGNNSLEFVCNLNEVYSKANWNLASLACEKDLKNFSVSFYHYAKHTFAKMQNYGVCENEASLSFLGTSHIKKGAKQSATHQSAKIMVFDPACKAKASPVLCIDENDVEASHAAVVGQINEEHVYYLMTRGIDEDSAKKLITLGYLKPILRFFANEEVQEKIKNSIEGRF